MVLYDISATIARLERQSLRERLRETLEATSSHRTQGGRPRLPIDLDSIRQLRLEGHSLASIARKVRCSRATLRRRLRLVHATDASDAC